MNKDDVKFHLYNFTKAVAGLAAAEATSTTSTYYGGKPIPEAAVKAYEEEYLRHQKLLYDAIEKV